MPRLRNLFGERFELVFLALMVIAYFALTELLKRVTDLALKVADHLTAKDALGACVRHLSWLG